MTRFGMSSRRPGESSPVVALSPADGAEAVGVLCEAFRDYPVMRYVLATAGSDYERHLEALVGFFCERRLEGVGTVLGLREDGTLSGAAVLDGVEDPSDEEMQHDRVRRLATTIGTDAVARLKAYDQVGEALMPPGVYHYLGMLGVRRAAQGKGVGRLLVEATLQRATAEPRSGGVCLHTESSENVPLYEHLGFEVVGEADLGEMRTWCMFRPRAVGAESHEG